MKIGIVGAGILGRLISLLLYKDHEVYLFDNQKPFPERQDSASLTAAGMIAPYCECEYATKDVALMGMKSLELWPKLIEMLKAPIYFQQSGSLVIGHTQDLAELSFLKRELNRFGFNETYETISEKRIQELEPSLAAKFHEGLFFPNEAQICPDDIFRAFNEYILPEINSSFETEVNYVGAHTVKTSDKEFIFDWVFDCRGVFAKKDISGLRGVRGEVIRLKTGRPLLNRPVRIMHPRYPIYLVPRPNNQIIIGATSIESEDRSPVSVRSALELLSAAYSVIPELGEARIEQQVANLRPAFSDNHPLIESEKGLTKVNGLYRHGYLLSPYVASKAILEMDTSQELRV